MRIELPWPPRECSQNFQRAHHWSKYRRQVKQYRVHCGWIVHTARAAGTLTDIHLHPPHNRYDRVNLPGMCKAAIDGIADALKVNDKSFDPHWHYHPAEPPEGKIVVEIA
jgi:crossover junction endodeoxyribonuclease RusA